MSLNELIRCAAESETSSMQKLLAMIVSDSEPDAASRWLQYLAAFRIKTYDEVALTAAEWKELLTIPCGEWAHTELLRALSPVSIANLQSMVQLSAAA